MHLNDAVDSFLSWCSVERRLSSHTLRAYASDLRDLRRALQPVDELRAVSENELRVYLASLLGERALSPATAKRRLACFRLFFRYLAQLGSFEDPFERWKPAIRRPKRLPRALSRRELTAITATSLADAPLLERVDAIPSETAIAVLTLAATGLRISELCSIQLEDVAAEAGAIRVTGKGSKDRIVYLSNQRLRDEIRRLREARLADPGGSRALFLNSRGAPLTPQTFRQRLHKLAAASNLERRVTPHMLRHTAATLLIENGVDIRFVQRLLGHASIATTEIYTHVSDESLRTALERANAVGDFV